jgi:hypothetical protein
MALAPFRQSREQVGQSLHHEGHEEHEVFLSFVSFVVDLVA